MDILQVIINLLGSLTLSFCMSYTGIPVRKNIVKYLIVACVYFISITTITCLNPSYDGSTVEPYISVITILALYMLVFRTNLFDTAFYMLFGFTVIVIFEMIALFILNLFSIPFSALLNNLRVLVIFESLKLVFALMLTNINAFRKAVSKIDNIVPYITAVLINVFIFIQFIRMLTDWILHGQEVSYIYIYILFFSIFLTNALLIRRVVKSQREQSQIKSYNEYEKMIIPLIENSRAIEHDFKNHLLTLKGLAAGSSEEFDNYLETINEEIKNNSVYKICQNPVMGALLQEKANFAQENDIDFDIEVYENELQNQDVKPYHLIAVISNLIDNAFEEVLNIDDDEKKVSIEYKKDEQIQIDVRNSLADKPAADINTADTKKRFSTKGKSRGYGLSNVKKITKEYNGQFEVYHESNTIAIKVTLNP